MPGGLGGRGQCLLGYHVPSHLGVGLEAACDHPFPTSFWKRLTQSARGQSQEGQEASTLGSNLANLINMQNACPTPQIQYFN